MRKLVLAVLTLAVCACAASAPSGPPPFETGWRFLDGATAGPDDKAEPPIPRTRKPAVYPIEARKQRLTGEVGVELTVDDQGNVVKAEVVQALEPTMDEAALVAVRQWTFTPARLNGVPKASVVREAVAFSLQ
jgi:TonB family protein